MIKATTIPPDFVNAPPKLGIANRQVEKWLDSKLPLGQEKGFREECAIFGQPNLSADEKKALDASYEHLCKMRDEVIGMGVLPAVADWKKYNANL